MIRKVVTLAMVMVMSSGMGTSAKAMTDRTVAPWVIALENRAVKTTPASVGGTCSVKKGQRFRCEIYLVVSQFLGVGGLGIAVCSSFFSHVFVTVNLRGGCRGWK